MMRFLLGWVCFVCLLASPPLDASSLHQCTDGSGRLVWRNEPCLVGEQDDQPGQIFETIPLLDRGVRGQYWIPVRINGQVSIDFLIDTGANIVVMPQEVIDKLVELGSITPADTMGETVAKMADGSLVRHAVVRVETLQIGGQVVKNVAVSVTPAKSMPLLGTPVLEQLGVWRIDHQKGQLSVLLNPAQKPPIDLSPESAKVMRQCWRENGSSYPSWQPCPPGAEVAPLATGAVVRIAQCRSILSWVQSYMALPGQDANNAQLKVQVGNYNKHCPGLIYQGDSGQAEILKDIVIRAGGAR